MRPESEFTRAVPSRLGGSDGRRRLVRSSGHPFIAYQCCSSIRAVPPGRRQEAGDGRRRRSRRLLKTYRKFQRDRYVGKWGTSRRGELGRRILSGILCVSVRLGSGTWISAYRRLFLPRRREPEGPGSLYLECSGAGRGLHGGCVGCPSHVRGGLGGLLTLPGRWSIPFVQPSQEMGLG